jgi:Fe-S-cluster containining protein
MQICKDCHAGCCRRFGVQITGYDMVRIKKVLDIDYLYFTQLTPLEPDYIEKNSKRIAIFKFLGLPKGEYYAFYLRSVPSKIMPDSRKCMFLQEWNDADFALPNSGLVTARCGIYETRPLTCRSYPARLHENRLIALTKDPNKFLDNVDNPAYKMCPAGFTQENVADESGEVVKSLVQYDYEMNYFRFLAETWNAGECDFGNFFAFLEQAYVNRLFLEE